MYASGSSRREFASLSAAVLEGGAARGHRYRGLRRDRRGVAVTLALGSASLLLSGAGWSSAPAATSPAPRAESGEQGALLVDAPCFIQPLRWNIALDGPIPRC